MGCSIHIKQQKRKHPTQVVIEQADEMIHEAENQLQRMDDFKKEMGYEPDTVRKFMQHPHFPEAERDKAQRELEEFRVQLDHDARAAADEARKNLRNRGRQEAPKPARAAVHRMRI